MSNLKIISAVITVSISCVFITLVPMKKYDKDLTVALQKIANHIKIKAAILKAEFKNYGGRIQHFYLNDEAKNFFKQQLITRYREATSGDTTAAQADLELHIYSQVEANKVYKQINGLILPKNYKKNIREIGALCSCIEKKILISFKRIMVLKDLARSCSPKNHDCIGKIASEFHKHAFALLCSASYAEDFTQEDDPFAEKQGRELLDSFITKTQNFRNNHIEHPFALKNIDSEDNKTLFLENTWYQDENFSKKAPRVTEEKADKILSQILGMLKGADPKKRQQEIDFVHRLEKIKKRI